MCGDLMKFNYNNNSYEVIIEKKRSNKNSYIRVKDDLAVHITTPIYASNFYIKSLLRDNYNSICKMIDRILIKKKNNDGFFYLGKKYTIVHVEGKKIEFINDRVYIGNSCNVDNWFRNKAKILFKERLIYNYNNFSRKIPKPSLRIRNMSSRWGVCNIKTHVITLNLNLIKRDVKYLDYVIIHELSHLVYGDHSAKFWNVVGENLEDYKKYRIEMRDF